MKRYIALSKEYDQRGYSVQQATVLAIAADLLNKAADAAEPFEKQAERLLSTFGLHDYQLSENPPPYVNWVRVEDFSDYFYEIRVIVNRNGALSAEEIEKVTNALGYALRQTIRGESISIATVIENGPNGAILEYSYDSTKTQSDDPDFGEAFAFAEEYIIDGSPVRKTNRSGPNTKGTSLAPGIGECRLDFYIR